MLLAQFAAVAPRLFARALRRHSAPVDKRTVHRRVSDLGNSLDNSAPEGIPFNIEGIPFTQKGTLFNTKGIPFRAKGTIYTSKGTFFNSEGTPFSPEGIPFNAEGVPFSIKGTPSGAVLGTAGLSDTARCPCGQGLGFFKELGGEAWRRKNNKKNLDKTAGHLLCCQKKLRGQTQFVVAQPFTLGNIGFELC